MIVQFLPEGSAYDAQREKVRLLCLADVSHAEIAKVLSLPEEKIDAYCCELGFAEKKTLVPPKRAGVTRCISCAAVLRQPWTGRRKRFCSDTCRNRWYYQKKNGGSSDVDAALPDEHSRSLQELLWRMENAPAEKNRQQSLPRRRKKKKRAAQPDAHVCKKKLRVAAYIRVSTELDSQKDSFAIQEQYFRQLLGQNPAWEFVGIYADYGISGTNMKKRDGFLRLMRHCEEGKIDRIVTKSISRFARNTGDFLRALRKLAAQGVTVLFEKEHLDTAEASSEFILTALGAIAQEESRSISGNVRWGYRKHYANGEAKNVPVYGYRYIEDTEKKGAYRCIEVVEEQADTVRRIFQEFLNGASYIQIARMLNSARTETSADEAYTGRERSQGQRWTPMQVAAVLRQERYTGAVRLQKSYIVDFMTHRQVKNDGELPQYLVECHHPPIISKEAFERAQQLAAQSTQGKPRQKKQKKQTYSYSGLLVCASCGKFYTVRNRKHHPIWYCPTGFPDIGKGGCQGKKLYETQVTALICTAVYRRFQETGTGCLRDIPCTADVFEGRCLASKQDVRDQQADALIQFYIDRLTLWQTRDVEGFLGRRDALCWMRTLPKGRAGIRVFLDGVSGQYVRAFVRRILVDCPRACRIEWFDAYYTAVRLTEGKEAP